MHKKQYRTVSNAEKKFPQRIRALKTLVWHLSREPIKEMSSLKNAQKVDLIKSR